MAENIEPNNLKREFSAGGIVFKKQDDQLLILLIRTSGATPAERNNVWGFPKGHIDEGEDAKTAALREVREEAGVDAEIVRELEPTEYSFVGYGKNIHKTVSWYLMEYVSGDITDHDDEVVEVVWLGIDEAVGQLTFREDKGNLEKAKQFIK